MLGLIAMAYPSSAATTKRRCAAAPADHDWRTARPGASQDPLLVMRPPQEVVGPLFAKSLALLKMLKVSCPTISVRWQANRLCTAGKRSFLVTGLTV